MGKLEFNTNNGLKLELTQDKADGKTLYTAGEEIREEIPAGDMVQLLNLYRYIKREDIQNDFINPRGKNKGDKGQGGNPSERAPISAPEFTIQSAQIIIDGIEKIFSDMDLLANSTEIEDETKNDFFKSAGQRVTNTLENLAMFKEKLQRELDTELIIYVTQAIADPEPDKPFMFAGEEMTLEELREILDKCTPEELKEILDAILKENP